MRLNQIVAIIGLILSCCVFFIMRQYDFPDKISYGVAILSILFVAMVWSTASITMGEDDEDQE